MAYKNVQRLNALGGNDKKEGNARKEAISAETGRKNFDGKLPVISKTKEQAEIISGKQLLKKGPFWSNNL